MPRTIYSDMSVVVQEYVTGQLVVTDALFGGSLVLLPEDMRELEDWYQRRLDSTVLTAFETKSILALDVTQPRLRLSTPMSSKVLVVDFAAIEGIVKHYKHFTGRGER